MNDKDLVLTKDEYISIMLRRLFEAYGYKRFRMAKFEPYDMYNKHRSFIESDSILTFTDRSGRLMAVKPDVTLAIAAGLSHEETEKKVFYNESVFRSEQGGDIREIMQTGVEAIGERAYTQCEVACLAVQALGTVGQDFVLLIGNIDYLSAFPALAALDAADKKRVLRLIGAKNFHGLHAALNGCGVQKPDADALIEALGVSGGATEVLAAAARLAPNAAAQAAAKETAEVFDALAAVGLAANARPDFTLVNDLSYYNGIVFQGYIKGVPSCVLSGGRYDNMMRRLHKPHHAVGFALRLNELSAPSTETGKPDCDVLIVGKCPIARLKAASKYVGQGKRVLVAARDDGTVTYARIDCTEDEHA